MRVGGADDFAEQRERGVGEFVFLEDGIERHVFAVMTEFADVNIERRRAQFARLRLDLLIRHEDKFGLRVNELLDESRAGHAVNLHFLAGNPFHRRSFTARCDCRN